MLLTSADSSYAADIRSISAYTHTNCPTEFQRGERTNTGNTVFIINYFNTSKITYRIPKVDCSRVAMPETKKIVEISSLLTIEPWLPIHSDGARTIGLETVAPNMIK